MKVILDIDGLMKSGSIKPTSSIILK